MGDLKLMVEAAWSAIAVRDKDSAMDYAKKAHRISPGDSDVQHLLGLLASRDGQHDLALQLLQEAITQGGKTARKLRDMAEALFAAGYAEQALAPLSEAVQLTTEDSHLLGLKSAILIDLEQWQAAQSAAERAIALDKLSLAWYLNASFAALSQHNFKTGFEYGTARQENLSLDSRCPAFHLAKPQAVWLRVEQGLGDSLFYLRYVPALKQLGWRFHIEADKRLTPLLKDTGFFETVSALNPCPDDEFWLSVGDLPLAAMQCGIEKLPPPLPLSPNPKLVDKYTRQLAEFGPPPYIAVSWRAGPQNKNSSQGIRLLDKAIAPHLLGETLAKTQATIINLQRLPESDELSMFHAALGRESADYTKLNNNLSGMLALLSIVDSYVAVSNTNVHLREGVGKSSQVLVNHPVQDWRWGHKGESVWYPSSTVLRQAKDKSWEGALEQLAEQLDSFSGSDNKAHTVQPEMDERSTHSIDKLNEKLNNTTVHQSNDEKSLKLKKTESIDVDQLLQEGWDKVAHDIPAAIQLAQQVINVYPDNAKALHLLGWAAMQDLQFKLGLSVLENAVLLAPSNGNIWRDYIRAHILVDQPEKAISIGLECLEKPDVWGKGVVHYALGAAYGRIDDDLNALQHFEACMRLIPNHLDAASAAGLTRMRLGDGYAKLGLKLNSARIESREPSNYPLWVCPVLKGDVMV